MAWGVPQGIRAAGAAQALGAPKGTSFGAKPAAKAKLPAAPKQKVVATRPQQMPRANNARQPGPAHVQPPKAFYEMNPAEIQHLATKQVQQETQANLAPYQAKSTELTGQEQATAKRYGGYGEETDKLLGGLAAGAEGAAKTYGNLAAESALKARGSVDTTGANTQQANGGYLDPQVKTALESQRANIAGIGASREAGAQAQGQGEEGFLRQLRATAAQRVTEGQQGIASTFGKQQAANQQGMNQLLGRQPGAISKLSNELTQRGFTDRATEAGLGIKQGTLRVGEANARTKAQQVAAGERNNATKNQLASEKLGLEGQKFSFTQKTKGEELAIKKLGAADKTRYDEAQIRYKHFQEANGGKAPSPKEGRAYMSKLSTAEAIARQALGNQRVGSKAEKHAKEEAVRKELAAKGANGDVISAALNLAVYGRLGPLDQHVAESYGLTKNLRPDWFKAK